MTAGVSKALAQHIETFQRHTLEEIGEHLLFRLIVGIKPQLHHHDEGQAIQETRYEGSHSLGVKDEHQQGVPTGQCPVKVKSYYPFHGITRLMS